MIHITLESAMASIKKAVELKGEDYVYPLHNETHFSGMVCRYATAGGDGDLVPDCIVGHVLADHGVSLDVMTYTDDNNCGPISMGGFSCMATKAEFLGIFTATKEAVEYLSEIQNKQDSGVAWGEAAGL